MRIKQFIYLRSVAETRSITKASRQLFVSHQAISYALSSLEADLQTTLFNRTPHGVTLTADGEYVLRIAKQILLLNEQLEQHFLDRADQRLTGSFKIAAISTLVSCILPQVQVQFIKRYPQVSLEISRMNVDPIVEALLKREIDLGFIAMTRIQGQETIAVPPELMFTPLSHFEYCAVIGPNSPLADYKTLSVKSLLHYPIVLLEEQVNNDLENYIPYRILRRYGQPQITIANSIELYNKLLMENMGISFSLTDPLLNYLIKEEPFVYKPLRDKIDGDMGYLLHRGDLDKPFVQRFLEVLDSCYPDKVRAGRG